MTASDMLIAHIKETETLKLTAYKADKGEKYLTIGWGHYGPDVKKGQRITEVEAEVLFRQDLATYEKYVNKLGVCKTQGQYDALVDFAYNVGNASLGSSTLLKKIRKGCSDGEIQDEFRRWKYCNGKVLEGLVKRREWECERWVSDE